MIRPHAFVPDPLGTACMVIGCWGWVDDPRHVFHVRLPKAAPVLDLAPRPTSRSPRGVRRQLRTR